MVYFKITLGILFGLVVAGIVFMAMISYKYYQSSVDTATWVGHTHSVIDKTEEISSSYKDIQLESSAILVDGDTSLINRYQAARRRMRLNIEELRRISFSNLAQQRRIDSLDAVVGRLIAFTDSVLTPHFRVTFTNYKLKRRFTENAAHRSKIDLVISDIKDAEKRLLLIQQKAYAASNNSFRNTFLQLIVGITILLVAMFFLIRYNFNKRVKAENDLRKAEDELKEALASEIELNKMKSNFVTLASHEFRTPLTTILSSTFLLEKYVASGDKEKVDKHLARIRSCITGITSILGDFLSITKIEEQKVVPHVERVNIKELLEGTCQDLGGLAKPGQSIDYTHTGEEFVVIDPVLLGNIVTNLISNAIKYSPENSAIIVKSSFDGRIHLLVKDCGIGIPMEDQKHLFKRFFRASNASAIQGTGLGLNIMKHYVDMLDGKIKLHSKPGWGTEVEITFDQDNYMLRTRRLSMIKSPTPTG